MDEIRIYERGGQVSIMAADMLTVLAFKDGEYAQAFPTFGVGCREAQVALFIPR
jgi:pyruvate ferredoxin oxidoreductase gamma subunit